MADKEIVLTDEARSIALEECELKIKAAWKRGLEATVIIGNQLRRIAGEELYKARQNESLKSPRPYTDFVEYVEHYLDYKRSTAYYLIKVAEGYTLLRDEFKVLQLPLPENESQVAELTRIEPEQRAHIWGRTVEICAQVEKPVTANRIRLVFEDEVPPEPSPGPAAQGGGVEVELDGFGPEEQASVQASPPPPKTASYSEKGERALDKIGRLCGQAIQEAIEKLIVPVSERDLLKWAELDDNGIRNLTHYVIDQRWSVPDAIKYEAELVSGETTLSRLAHLCLARGGHPISFLHDIAGAKIQVTLASVND